MNQPPKVNDMCEAEYRARLKDLLTEIDILNIDDIIADKVAECKGDALCSFLSLEDIFDKDIEDVSNIAEVRKIKRKCKGW